MGVGVLVRLSNVRFNFAVLNLFFFLSRRLAAHYLFDRFSVRLANSLLLLSFALLAFGSVFFFLN